ncbi:MAG: site-specific DNA-methyltransferase [Polyangia bacterium]
MSESKIMASEFGENFGIYHADTVEVSREFPDDSVDLSVFSPPFSSLFTYSNSDRDLGNVKNDAEFFAHYDFLAREQFRVTKPGRLVAIHCMLLPTSKVRDGYIGLRDFRGDLIRLYQAAGFVFHSEVCIWKNPVTAMQRTKALGLLHKQIRKDSCMSRQGIPDYVVVMRKPGVNAEPVSHTHETFPVETWQRYASPVWVTRDGVDDEGFDKCRDAGAEAGLDGIRQSDTLQYRSARENDDERHICPLQLEVIRRCIRLWSNPGDVVWSPFMGIGSEGVVALQMGRKFIGAELKESYYKQAAANLKAAEVEAATSVASPTADTNAA